MPSRQLRPGWILVGIIMAFVAVRLPAVLLQPGGQDEQWFAPPGYTVATEGIPRLPYVPNRNPDSPFYRADEALFALPPGFFYLQAPAYALFPAGYPTGRLPSMLGAVVAIWLTYELGRRWFGQSAALWGAGLYAGSRVLLFPATFARPDMACGAAGLAAVVVLSHWPAPPGRKRLVMVGGLLGVGLLLHPFAIVYCLLAGVWVVLSASGWRRLTDSALLVTTTVAVTALWLPLILAHQEAFQHQFFNNVLGPQGPGLLRRLAFPWPYFRHELKLLYEQGGVCQTVLMLTGVLVAVFQDLRRPGTPARRAAWVLCGVIYLQTACQGLHPTKGYLCFVGALMFLAVGRVVSDCGRQLSRWGRYGRAAAWTGAVSLVLLMVPGSGLRGWMTQVSHWSSPEYNGPRFAQTLLAVLPSQGRFVVDTSYVFDFWLAGRDAVLVADPLNDYPTETFAYDFLVVGREGLDKQCPERYRGIFVRSVGRRDNPLSCYAEIYRSPDSKPQGVRYAREP
jgi:hypothetical protein